MDDISLSFKKIYDKIDKIKKDLLDQRFINELAKTTADIIYKRVKSGYGVSENGEKVKLAKLEPSYIAYRKGLVKFYKSKLHGKVYPVRGKFLSPVKGEFGSPGRSNLTLTGQMLNAIGIAVKDRQFRLFIENTPRKDGLTNLKVAEYVTENGRPFFDLTKQEYRIIFNIVQRHVTNIIRRYFNGK